MDRGGAGVVLALGVAGYAGVSYYGYDQLTAATPHCNNRFPDAYTPANFGTEGIAPAFTEGGFDTGPYAMPGYQEVSFPSRDARQPRLTIRAWWVPAEEAGAPAVIVVHGRNSCRHDPVVLLPAGMLARNGFSVLMMDMRDQGDSDIEDGRSGWGSEEYLDVLGAWDWLQSAQGLQASRIGLMGESLGASSAIIAMGEEQAIAATWADSGFADLGVLFDELIAAGTAFRPGSARASLPGRRSSRMTTCSRAAPWTRSRTSGHGRLPSSTGSPTSTLTCTTRRISPPRTRRLSPATSRGSSPGRPTSRPRSPHRPSTSAGSSSSSGQASDHPRAPAVTNHRGSVNWC